MIALVSTSQQILKEADQLKDQVRKFYVEVFAVAITMPICSFIVLCLWYIFEEPAWFSAYNYTLYFQVQLVMVSTSQRILKKADQLKDQVGNENLCWGFLSICMCLLCQFVLSYYRPVFMIFIFKEPAWFLGYKFNILYTLYFQVLIVMIPISQRILKEADQLKDWIKKEILLQLWFLQ